VGTLSTGGVSQLSLVGLALLASTLTACATRQRSSVFTSAGWALALFALGAALGIHDKVETARRVDAYFGPHVTSLELELRGKLLALPEVTLGGERLLLVSGRPTGRPQLPAIRVALRVAASPPEATRVLDRLARGRSIRIWCRLYRPRGLGNPDSDDPAERLAARGFDALGSVKSARLVELADPPGRAPRANWIDGSIKRHARERLDELLGEETVPRALAGAMLLGDRGRLAPATLRTLRDAGMIHLVAISGLHVGLIVSLLVALLVRSRLPTVVRVIGVGGLLLTFAFLVGPRPSVARAAAAGFVAQFGRGLGRSGDALNTLAWIASILVIGSPAAVLNPGLQLTVAATAGVLLALEGDGGRGVQTAMRVSAGAYLASAPLSAWHFGWLAPVALASNLFAVPLCAAMLLGGYAGIALHTVPLVGAAAGRITVAASDGLLAVAELAGRFDASSFAVARPAVGLIVLYYCAWTLVFVARKDVAGVVRGARAIRVLAWLSVLWLHNGPPPPPWPDTLEASIIDVGQGQSIVVRERTGASLLIDTGGSFSPRFDVGERIVVPYLLRRAGRRIDHLVLSHDHLDHVGGARALIRSLELGELCLPPGFHRSKRLMRIAAEALDEGVALRLCETGQRIGRYATVLGPGRGLRASVNDRSVAVLIDDGNSRLLVPGDLERAGEASLTSNWAELKSQALVLSHHGSRTGSTFAFLAAVEPRLAIASCGRSNRFGHPHAETIERVRSRPVTIWRTDRDGAIVMNSHERGWSLRSTRR